MPRDFSAKQIRVSQLIASGGNGTNAGLLVYSASDGTNYTGGFPATLTSGIGPDVFLFVSGTEGGKARGEGVTLFGGDVVISGTMYAEKSIIEVDVTSTGSMEISGSLFVSQSATINEGLTVNNTGESGPENDFTVKGSSNTTLLFGDVSTNRIGIGVADPDSTLEVFSSTTQLKLSNNGADFATFAVGTDGDLTVTTVDAAAGAADFTVVADGAVDIDANQGTLSLDGSAGINIGTETNVAIDMNSTTLDIDATGQVTIDTAATFSVDAVGATNLTTHGALTLSGSDGLNIASDEGEIDLTTRQGNIDVNATDGSIDIDAASAITVTASGAELSLNANGSNEVDITTSGPVDINATSLTIDGSSTFSIDGVGASNITTNGALTVSGSTGLNLASDSGEIDITTRQGLIDINASGGAIDIDATGAIDIDGASGINIGTASDVAIDINSSTLDIDSSDNITITAGGSGKVVDVDASGALTLDSSTSVSLGTAIAGVAVNIGHTTSETTVNDNLSVTGNTTVNGNLGVNGIITGSLGLSGSLTRLVDGKSFIEAGANITVTSASNGAITITGTGGSPGGSNSEVQFNDNGNFGGINNVTTDGNHLIVLDAGELRIGTGTDLIVSSSNDDVVLGMATNNKDLIFRALDGNTDKEVMRIDGSGNSLVMGANNNTVSRFMIQVADGENRDCIDLIQDDSGNAALDIDSEGEGISINAKEALTIIVDEDAGYGALISRNKGDSAVSDPLVKIRDQDGDQQALRVLAESVNPAAFAIGVGNAGGVKSTMSGSGQMALGKGTNAYSAMLHVKGINRGDGIVLEDADSTDTVVKIYEDVDDGIVDVYANNGVSSRIHGNGISFVGGDFQVTGANLDIAEYIRHLDDLDTTIQFDTNAIRLSAGGTELINANKAENTISFNSSQAAVNTVIFTDNKIALACGTPNGGDQVLIMSGGAAGDDNYGASGDVLFYVSGAIDSRNTSTRGSSVFGGDVVVSGALDVNTVSITSDGKLGIGTTNPSYKLEVGGNAAFGEFLYHRGDTDTFIQFADDAIGITVGNEQLITITEAGQDIVKIGDGGDVDFQVRTNGDDNTLFVQGSSDRVGIGTNSPSTVLHVKESAPTVTIQRESNSNDSTLQFMGQAGATATVLHMGLTNDLVMTTFDGSDQEEILRLGSHYAEDVRQVIMLSGSAMHAGAMHPKESTDINFFASGSTNSRGTATRGTAVFGGDVVISGSLTARQLHFTTHKLSPGDSNARFVRFDSNGGDQSVGDNNKMNAPYAGSLIKVVVRGTNAPGSTVVGLHTNTDTNQNLNGTATEEITVNMSAANTCFTFSFTAAANYGPGDIVGIKINPSSDPGTVTATATWEFETYS